jgi:hypothetical protein
MRRQGSMTGFHLPRLRLVALVAVGLLTASCGYSSKPLYNPSYHTISVPIAINRTFHREWEFRLTEALTKNIEYRTPYKVVGAQDKADTILSCEITSIEENVLTQRPGTTIPREKQVTIVCSFVWKDRNGRLLVERKDFNRSSTDIQQIGERIEDAEQLAVERLASAIVDQLQSQW